MSSIKIRECRREDIEFLFELRNDNRVRQSAFRTDLVTWEEHQKWFLNRYDSSNTIILIAEEDGGNVGQIRFDLKRSTDDDIVAEVHIAVQTSHANKGIGQRLLKMGCAYMCNNYQCNQIVAHIKPSNIASQKAFQKAGFLLIGEMNLYGQSCIEMVFNC